MKSIHCNIFINKFMNETSTGDGFYLFEDFCEYFDGVYPKNKIKLSEDTIELNELLFVGTNVSCFLFNNKEYQKKFLLEHIRVLYSNDYKIPKDTQTFKIFKKSLNINETDKFSVHLIKAIIEKNVYDNNYIFYVNCQKYFNLDINFYDKQKTIDNITNKVMEELKMHSKFKHPVFEILCKECEENCFEYTDSSFDSLKCLLNIHIDNNTKSTDGDPIISSDKIDCLIKEKLDYKNFYKVSEIKDAIEEMEPRKRRDLKKILGNNLKLIKENTSFEISEDAIESMYLCEIEYVTTNKYFRDFFFLEGTCHPYKYVVKVVMNFLKHIYNKENEKNHEKITCDFELDNHDHNYHFDILDNLNNSVSDMNNTFKTIDVKMTFIQKMLGNYIECKKTEDNYIFIFIAVMIIIFMFQNEISETIIYYSNNYLREFFKDILNDNNFL